MEELVLPSQHPVQLNMNEYELDMYVMCMYIHQSSCIVWYDCVSICEVHNLPHMAPRRFGLHCDDPVLYVNAA